MANVEINNNGYLSSLVEINDSIIDVYGNLTYAERVSSALSALRSFDYYSSADILANGTYTEIQGGLSLTGSRYTVNLIGNISSSGSTLTKYEIIDNSNGDLVAFQGNLRYSSLPILSSLTQGSTLSSVVAVSSPLIVLIEAAATQGSSSITGTISKITSAYISSSTGGNVTAFASEVLGSITFSVPTTSISSSISVSGTVNEFGVGRVTANEDSLISSGTYTVTDWINFSGLSLSASLKPSTDILSSNDRVELSGSSSITFNSSSGDDVIYSHQEANNIDGGTGSDIVVYDGLRNAFTITKNSNLNYTVREIGNPTNTDNLTNIELLRFSDQDYFIGLNSAPTGKVTITGAATQGQLLTASNTLADPNGLGTITYSWYASGSDSVIATGSTYRLSQSEVGKTITAKATYTDGNGASEMVASSVSKTVANVNDAPVLANSISDQSATEGRAFRFTLPNNTFSDIDTGDTLTLSTSKLPKWLKFDAKTGVFSGTPLDADSATSITVRVTGTDKAKAKAFDDFVISIAGENVAPSAKTLTKIATATEGKAFTYSLPKGTFTDGDRNDTLTYSAISKPDWINIDSATGKLTGTPGYTVADSASTTITFVATDRSGLAASTTLTVTLKNTATIKGTANADTITAGTGADNITGLAGNDTLTGGDGNDILNGGLGEDTMMGGADNDTYVVDNLNDVIIENAGEGTDLVQVAIAGANGTYTLSGHLENGTLTNKVAFNLTGNSLDNTLIGNAAANILDGGDGDDRLIGGLGNDILTGGEGSDTFVFNTKLNAKTNLDAITDFESGTDIIELAKSIMTRLGNVGELTAAQFKIGSAASESSHRIIYNETTGGLFYDADGSGKGAAVQIALLGVNTDLTHDDIFIV